MVICSPSACFPSPPLSPAPLRGRPRQSTAKHFDLGKYKDEYAGKLAKLVEGKAKRQKIAVGGGHEEPAVINWMDALKRSLDATGHTGNGKGTKHAGHPRKTRATGARKKTG